MLKKITIIFMVLFCTFFIMSPYAVEAHSMDVVHRLDDTSANCDALLGDPTDSNSVAYFLQQILTVMKYAGPLLCLVLSVVDFVKAAASQDKDALNKATKTTGKRIVYALVLFFIPTLINFIFPLLGWYGTCGIS